MRIQPPHENNPANPLLKVAALQIRLEKEAGAKKLHVMTDLQFKRSDDLSGITKTKDGSIVTVTFSLAIRRASVRLIFRNDLGASPRGFVRIDDAAFLAPLAIPSRVVNEATLTRKSSKDLVVGVSAALSPQNGGAPSIEALGRTNLKNGVSKDLIQNTKREFKRTNVRVTYTENEVHWEITPEEDDSLEPQAFLDGAVFRNEQNEPIISCIAMKNDTRLSSICVTSSVFVNVTDLIIDKISFTDPLGEEVGLHRLENVGISMLNIQTKRRILKQVIRKHLIDQGMSVDGSRIEICRAET